MDQPQSLVTLPWRRGASLRSILELNLPKGRHDAGDRQLDYVARYIEKPDLHVSSDRSLLIEPHYIDGNFLEDCGAFYVHNLKPPENYCRRVHFFACEMNELDRRLMRLWRMLRSGSPRLEQACIALSRELYLGYTLVRPLPGCPVGRTVLLAHPAGDDPRFVRRIAIVRSYDVHVGGLTLSISGLAFQQQDRAVSACATVAIWSAFHRLNAIDNTPCPSPSSITRAATRYSLPFGRSLPAGEGINVSQMCIAVESMLMSPVLRKMDDGGVARLQQMVHAASESGYPAILVLERTGIWDDREPPSRRFKKSTRRDKHAVTVVGVKQTREADFSEPIETVSAGNRSVRIHRAGTDVASLYIHDDRIGPYRRADIVGPSATPARVAGKSDLRIRLHSHTRVPAFECWRVLFFLLPVHPRIRVDFAEMDHQQLLIAQRYLIPSLISCVGAMLDDAATSIDVRMDYWIERGHEYQQRVARDSRIIADTQDLILQRVGLPRHVAVLRYEIRGDDSGVIDVIMDTTSSPPNLNFLFVVTSGSEKIDACAEDIASALGCAVI